MNKAKIFGIIGVISSVIGIFVFLTGKNLPDYFNSTKPLHEGTNPSVITHEQIVGKTPTNTTSNTFDADNIKEKRTHGICRR